MTTQPERLHHLLDRARRGVILPAEGEQLAEMVGELEADNARYEEVVVGDLNEANIRLQRQAARAEATVARVRQAVDAGPVGSCCAHLIHAALNPPPAVKRCGCGRPDPGPCQPCPDNSPSLHCACDCTPTQGAA
ncbi:hypothetical protein [Streptomyces badius]|uniref:hypothetical protein n=1 Tax=Streptomyces badius TaxID=1941 RepID=UPI00190CA830|nr:hypothetical protein [Streptomyces badius]